MVLEARENAEKISYPVIGEVEKEASNVINYNIRAEITKDKSAVINADNDTTTGMATVIPGLNEPQLLYDTSIHKFRVGEKPVSVGITGYVGSNESKQLEHFVYVTTSDLDFGSNTTYLNVPVTGLYKIHFQGWDQQYGATPNPSITNTFTILRNGNINTGEILAQETTPYRTMCTIDIEVVLYKNDIIRFRKDDNTGASGLWYCSADITKQ